MGGKSRSGRVRVLREASRRRSALRIGRVCQAFWCMAMGVNSRSLWLVVWGKETTAQALFYTNGTLVKGNSIAPRCEK